MPAYSDERPTGRFLNTLLNIEETRSRRAMEEMNRKAVNAQITGQALQQLMQAPASGRAALSRLYETAGVDPEILATASGDAPDPLGITQGRSASRSYEQGVELDEELGTPADVFRLNPELGRAVGMTRAVRAGSGLTPGEIRADEGKAMVKPETYAFGTEVELGTARSIGQQDALNQWAQEFNFRGEQAEQAKAQFNKNYGLAYREMLNTRSYQDGILGIQRAQLDGETLKTMATYNARIAELGIEDTNKNAERQKQVADILERMTDPKITPVARRMYAMTVFRSVGPAEIKGALGLPQGASGDEALNALLGVDYKSFFYGNAGPGSGEQSYLPPNSDGRVQMPPMFQLPGTIPNAYDSRRNPGATKPKP